jgi:glycosyltransferase involved in cell wall biosynthesis
VKAAVILKEKGIDNILFCLVGDGRYKEKLSGEIKDNNVEEMFRLYPKIPPDQIPDVFAQVEASLICLSKSEIFALTVPAKTQSCLACGKPILVCADGEIQNIITEARCGFVANAGDAEYLAENIEKLQSLNPEELKEMGLQAINYYNNNFNKQKLLEQMDEYLLS